MSILNLNTIILNESNIFVSPNGLQISYISYIGIDLIFLGKDIRAAEFRSIYNFVDSKIL
jgi:hypothetical protein